MAPGRPQLPHLVIGEHPLGAAESQQLIAELDDHLRSIAVPGEVLFISLTDEQVAPGAGQFLVAWLDGVPVGCGAFRMIGGGTAEVKRMYVRPSARGNKIGAALLRELEARAMAVGATRLALETGPQQIEALSMYGKAGFAACECWGEYAEAHHSVCLDKSLT